MTIEIALQGLQWETSLIYIDDIIVYGSSYEQHVIRVEQVLELIKSAGLKLKSDKCHLLKTKVVFLGHVVSREGVLPDPSNVHKIAEWPRPSNAKQVKQFVATGCLTATALSRCPTPRDCTCSQVDMTEPLKCGPCAKCT